MPKRISTASDQEAASTLKRALAARGIRASAVSCQYRDRGRHVAVLIRYGPANFEAPILVKRTYHLSLMEADEIAGLVQNEIALTIVVNRTFKRALHAG